MSREALMKFREGVLADEGLQQEIRELMEAGDVEKANAWVEEKGYTDVGFTTEEIVDFLENPGADVELSDLELEFVSGGLGAHRLSPLQTRASSGSNPAEEELSCSHVA